MKSKITHLRQKSYNSNKKFSSFQGKIIFQNKKRIKKIDFEDLKIKCWKFLNFLKITKIPSNFLDIIFWDTSDHTKISSKRKMFVESVGIIGRSYTFGMKFDFRWLKLNPIEGSLIEYKTKGDCPNKPYKIIPLSSITDISLSNQKWLMK